MCAPVRKTLGLFFVFLFFDFAQTVDSRSSRPLTSREIKGGEQQTTTLVLSFGQYALVRVEQEGIDVIVVLRDPDGKRLVEINRPIGAHGPEWLHVVAERSGPYLIEVRAANQGAQAGRFSLTISAARLGQETDRLLTTAQQALAEGRTLRASGRTPNVEQAVTVFASAARDFERAQDFARAADALIEQGRTAHFLGSTKTAETCYERARRLYHQASDLHGEALALYRLGGAAETGTADYYRQALAMAEATGNQFIKAKLLQINGFNQGTKGKHKEGLAQVRVAIEIQQALGYRYDEADALLPLGWMQCDLGELQAGVDAYRKAARLHREDQNHRELANALLYVADGWLLLKDEERAQDTAAESVRIARAGGYQLVEILALNKLSDVYLQMGKPREALIQSNAALPLAEKNNYQINRVWKRLGQAHLAARQFPQAFEALAHAAQMYEKDGPLSGLPDVRYYLAEVYQQMGEPQKASAEWARALTGFQQQDERLGVARTLLAQARWQTIQGETGAARTGTAAALVVLESLRKELDKYSDRTTFFTTIAAAYKQQISLLMSQAPSGDAVRMAFAVSERARARALLEMVTESRLRREGEKDAEFEGELRAAQETLNNEALARFTGTSVGAAANARLRVLTAEVENVQVRLRAANPRLAALTQPQTLDVTAVQQLLDPDCLLLEYSLGEERSFVWAITRDDITSYELPNRARIEAAARAFHQALAANKPSQTEAVALSQLVLAPLAARLQKLRLLIVADGALQYVPFAALPTPNAERGTRNDEVKRSNSKGVGAALHRSTLNAHPLIIDHEIVNLPSASVLAVLRHEAATRPAASRAVAVFAAPVFERTDSGNRLRNGTCAEPKLSTKPPLVSATVLDGEMLRHLPSFTDEANEIRCLAPRDSALVKMGFEATRAAVLQSDLTSYRILHFATHGQLDDTHPDLSWLALSMVDQSGKAQDGFLRLHEIYNLKLNADLVVLSACQTALGKEVKGEGLLGLTRGFMYAGTPRVVASLWKVNSVATTELMKRFYRNMLKGDKKRKQKLSPAAALRAAQLEIGEGLKLPSPYYWAAFVLQGEWR